jgi:hypothetical protein
VLSRISRILPIETSPLWKRFTTHPREIIGQVRRLM